MYFSVSSVSAWVIGVSMGERVVYIMSVEPADANKRVVKERLIRMVKHQTSRSQPDSVALEDVKVVASHESIDAGYVE